MSHDPNGTPTREDFRDAVAWLYAHLNHDTTGTMRIAQDCDPVGMVAALTGMFIGLASISTDGQPRRYVDHLRDNLDHYVDLLEAEPPQPSRDW